MSKFNLFRDWLINQSDFQLLWTLLEFIIVLFSFQKDLFLFSLVYQMKFFTSLLHLFCFKQHRFLVLCFQDYQWLISLCLPNISQLLFKHIKFFQIQGHILLRFPMLRCHWSVHLKEKQRLLDYSPLKYSLYKFL